MSIKSPLSRQFGSRFDSVFDVVKSNPVYDKVSRIPTLDLNFAKSKSLYDGRSTKNLIDHVRDTAPNSSTYVDAAGLIKRSVTNLALNSTMNTGYISTNNEATYEVDQTTAPDGTLTGNKFTESSNTSGRYVRLNAGAISWVSGKFYILSCYFKEGVNTNKRYAGLILLNTSFGDNKQATFDLTGDGTATPDPDSNEAPAVYGIEAVGNGWYRCWIGDTATTSASSREQYRITDRTDGATSSYTGDGSSHIFMWGVQVEEFDSQQSTPGEYVKTTTTKSGAPRFDHDPATGESLGLLVEESRENIMTYSAATTSNWTNTASTCTDLSLNALGVFPGVRAASLGQVYHGINTPAVTLTDGTTYTVTFWFRAGDVNPSNMIRFLLRNDTDAKVSTVIKTSTSTNYEDVSAYSKAVGATGAPTNVTILSVEKLSDGLTYKMSVSFDAVGVDKSHFFGIHTNSDVSGESIIALGLQLEEGAFPTSYIPTEGATVTRGLDVASITGTNFTSFFDATKGTLYGDAYGLGADVPSNDYQTIAAFSDGTNNARIELGYMTATSGYFNIRDDDGNISVALSPTITESLKRRKGAGAYNSSYAAVSYNGSDVSNDGTVTLPTTINQLDIGALNDNNIKYFTGTIKRITYWNQRLSNTILETITS